MLIGTYLCTDLALDIVPQVSHEHKQLKWFNVDSLEDLAMPDGYRTSIRAALRNEPT